MVQRDFTSWNPFLFSMKRLKFYLLFFLSLGATKAFSSFDFNERVQEAYQQIIRMKFDAGTRLLDEEQKSNPSNVLPLLYYSYIDFLKAFISEEKKDYESFSNSIDDRSKKLEDADSPFSMYARAELMVQEAMLKVKFREFVSAAWEIRRAYKMIEKNSDRFPSFPLNKKLMGFMHVMIGVVPKNYQWLNKLAGMEGTIAQGEEELTGLSKGVEGNEYKVYKEEILFYLASIRFSYSKDEKRTNDLAEMIRPFCSQSQLMRYCYSNLMMRSGRNEEAVEVLTDTTAAGSFYPFYFLRYKTGLARLRKLDFSAEADFQQYVSRFHGLNYLRSSCQQIAWIYLLRGDQKKYHEWIAQCLNKGTDLVDEDKDATTEATSGEMPNLLLLRARLLFDGGYYKQSLAEIAGKPLDNFPRFRDQLEVTYRFARILQKMKQTDQSIEYYKQTLKNGALSKYYFAANAALILGNIYEEKRDFEKAKSYYQQCLALRDHEYQNSLDQKAQAGLERIKKEKQ